MASPSVGRSPALSTQISPRTPAVVVTVGFCVRVATMT
jgi:hypothetical protein